MISRTLSSKKTDCSCALIPFIVAGYPSINLTIELLRLLDSKRVDVIELGIPYSDALADGPVIQNASKIALSQGVYINEVLNILVQVTCTIKTPIIIFTYYNPVFSRGVEKFVQEISISGAKGLIIPDLPIEETDYLICLCNYYEIELILFISPTSSKERTKKILAQSPGCLYVVSRTGVTGFKHSINSNLKILFKHIKSTANKSLMLGFGISNSHQASVISKWDIDGIVMGTAFIQLLSNYSNETNFSILNKISTFLDEIKLSISK